MLRLGPAARRLGIHPLTLRRWADAGRIEVVWVGGKGTALPNQCC